MAKINLNLWKTIYNCAWCGKPIKPNKAGLCPKCLKVATSVKEVYI